MSGNGHLEIHDVETFQRRAQTSTRRVNRTKVTPHGISKWMWPIGLVTTLASAAVLLMGQEPSLFNYLATSALLGSMGLLAFVATSRALHVGARYEESVLHVKKMKRSYHSLRQVFSTAMDHRDEVTGGHSDRVVELALELAHRMGLSEKGLHHLEWSAFLHDIGKVRVDADILTKPGPLNAGEWGEMQQHPYFSYAILMQVDSLHEEAEIVYSHHERYDGMGYPRRLRGSEIPFEARIFSVADAYDAMVSERPYRESRVHDEAMCEIISHAGTQFDPQVVTAFADWALSNSDESTRQVVEEEFERLPADLPRLKTAPWA